MGIFVIVAYKPKPDKEDKLLEAVRDHMPVLKSQGFITERPAYVMRAMDGTIVEVFEWKSNEAVEQAHKNEAVLTLWKRFDEVCEYTKLANLKECSEMFASFEPIGM